MKPEIVLPNYEHSILNIITSILKHYQVETPYAGLEKLDKLLEKKHKNIVLILLDGMGENILHQNSPNGLFCENQIDKITSVYPSTTAAAMTTYYAGKPPIETGWIAWSQYFKEFGRAYDILPEKDSYTGEKFDCKKHTLKDIIGYQTIYEKIEETNPKIKTYEVVPSYCAKKAKMSMMADDIEEMCGSIETLCKNNQEKFVLAYYDNPDSIIHKYGCYAKETKVFLEQAQDYFKRMMEQLKDTNTIMILAADHGLIDIEEKIDIMEIAELQECFIMPPTLESRMVGFYIHQDRKKEFEEKFKNIFQDKFLLYRREEILEKNLLGNGKEHYKIKDFLGDYVAIAVSGTVINIENYLTQEKKKKHEKKATHCGLTKKEMEVPLIILEP